MDARTWMIALALGAAACGGRATPPPTIGNTAVPQAPDDAAPGQRDGALWTCQIDDYDPQPCKLSRDDAGGWRLTKLLGSQRFRGTMEFHADGARLVGEYFCPWGSCTEAIDVAFTRADDGAYVGEVTEGRDPLRVQYDAANDAAFGGAGYGGLTGDEE
ncbi:MAG: hypothetical protein JNK64_35960 [Myxococcales bacterium]|nr:hypothetical protein [Myxococcales bacterium]